MEKLHTTPPGDIFSLIKRVQERLDEELSRRRVEEKNTASELLKLAAKEKQLIVDIAKSQEKIAEKEAEFILLQKGILAKNKAEIEGQSIKSKDVLSGKKTMRDFLRLGKQERQIHIESIEQTQSEMAEISGIIRAENRRIMSLELRLLVTQNTVRGLASRPAQGLSITLKALTKYLDGMIAPLQTTSEIQGRIRTKKESISLADGGGSLSRGHAWSDLSVEEMGRLRFSPVISEDHILALNAEVEKFKDADPDARFELSYYWKTGEFQIIERGAGGMKSTSGRKSPTKGKAILTTADISTGE